MAQVSRPFQFAIRAFVEARLPDHPYHYGGVQVPDSELVYPYIVHWPIPAVGEIANLAGNLIPRLNEVRFVVCGRDADEVLWALDEIAAALIGQRPVIDGWNCNLIRQGPDRAPVVENPKALFQGRPTWTGWGLYRMGAEPAPITTS